MTELRKEFNWVKRLGQGHYVEPNSSITHCGKPTLGNNYAGDIEVTMPCAECIEVEESFAEVEPLEPCVLCRNWIPNPIVLHGMNPWPLSDYGKCCRECNKKVLVARLAWNATAKLLQEER